MNPTDYSQLPLRDIHLPDAIGWWPPAVGWWMLLGLGIVAGAIVLWRYRSRFRERAALRALRAARAALETGAVPVDCVQKVSIVIRRFAISVGSGVPVAGLTGEQWLAFLDSRWDRSAFAEGAGRLMIYGPYAPPGRVAREDVATLTDLCIEWIGAQRRSL
jgi:hypothetical protein